MEPEDEGDIAQLVAAAEAAETQAGEKKRKALADDAERKRLSRAASALANNRPVGQTGRPRKSRPGSACSDPGTGPLPAGMPAGVPRLEPHPPRLEPPKLYMPHPPGPGTRPIPPGTHIPSGSYLTMTEHLVYAEEPLPGQWEFYTLDDRYVTVTRDRYLYLLQLEAYFL